MNPRTQEWFRCSIHEIRRVLFAKLPEDNWCDMVARTQEVKTAIMEITGMNNDEASDYLVEKLFCSETEREAFFSKYNIPREPPCTFLGACLQMLADENKCKQAG